jgi:autotransporter-associated beta strand protein
MKIIRSLVSLGIAVMFCSQALCGSATWNLNAVTNLWNDAENWTPAAVPNAETDVATFGVSNVTDVLAGGATSLQNAENDIAAIVLAAGASAYTIMAMPSSDTTYSDDIVFWGAGIVNYSDVVQKLVAQADAGPVPRESGAIWFVNSASAGSNIVITNQGSGSSGTDGGWTRFGLQFADTPNAGNATFINEGGLVSGTEFGGTTDLFSYSTAESATFINQPGVVDAAAAGHTFLYTGGNIGSSTFINNAATVTGAEGGWTELDIGICNGATFIANGATSAGPQGGQVYTFGGSGYAIFTAEGGQGAGAEGGLIAINNMPNSNQTIVTAEAGVNGGLGGLIQLNVTPSSLDQVQFQLLGNGTMDLSGLLQNMVTIGSLSGHGTVLLSRFILDVGSNNLSTTFSGVIQDNGGITKSGTGTLSLTGANTYRHGTTVNNGKLLVANQGGSGTGTGLVQVNSGTLGGTGIISGKTTIGTGSGTGAFLAPASGSNVQATLTIRNTLTFNADATYTCTFRAKRSMARSDKVIAKGVTINSGAVIALSGQIMGHLNTGLTLTLISNTSPNPISGTFSNLPDGGTVAINGNNFQASYSGGDGNDLTLTVVP